MKLFILSSIFQNFNSIQSKRKLRRNEERGNFFYY
jgi:hypothetical protein